VGGGKGGPCVFEGGRRPPGAFFPPTASFRGGGPYFFLEFLGGKKRGGPFRFAGLFHSGTALFFFPPRPGLSFFSAKTNTWDHPPPPMGGEVGGPLPPGETPRGGGTTAEFFNFFGAWATPRGGGWGRPRGVFLEGGREGGTPHQKPYTTRRRKGLSPRPGGPPPPQPGPQKPPVCFGEVQPGGTGGGAKPRALFGLRAQRIWFFFRGPEG